MRFVMTAAPSYLFWVLWKAF